MGAQRKQTTRPEQDSPNGKAFGRYFLSLSVENVRCFAEKQPLDLSDKKGGYKRWTVLLGENGVGKTTLLQFLNGFQIEKVPFGSQDVIGFRYHSALYDVFKRPFFSSNRLNCPQSVIQCHRIFEVFQSVREGRDVIVQHSFFLSGRGLSPVYGGILDSDIGIDSIPVFPYPASRHLGEETARTEKNDVPGEIAFFADRLVLPSAEEWLLNTDHAARLAAPAIQEKSREQFEAVKKVLLGVLPEDIEDITIPQLTSLDQSPHVVFKTVYGDVSMRSLGIGHRTMIAWIVDLARKMFEHYPDSPDPIAQPAVVLVDEIDLHLHPAWQRKLIGFLTERFKQTQFIVTAHSPLIVQSALDYDANIAVLRREGDHVVIENGVAEKLKGLRVDQILTTAFDLMSARSPQTDRLYREREEILSKPELDETDKRRLREIRSKIGETPSGERPADIEAMDFIRRAAVIMKNGEAKNGDKNKPPAEPAPASPRKRRAGNRKAV